MALVQFEISWGRFHPGDQIDTEITPQLEGLLTAGYAVLVRVAEPEPDPFTATILRHLAEPLADAPPAKAAKSKAARKDA